MAAKSRKTAKRAKTAKKPAKATKKTSAPKARASARPKPASPVIGSLGMVTLHVDDFPRAVAFYRDALELKVLQVLDVPGLQWAEFALAPGFKLGLHADPEGHEEGARSPGGASGFYFTVPDVDAAVAKLRERGVKIADEPEDKPYGRDAAFLDPDGNLIAIVAPAPEG